MTRVIGLYLARSFLFQVLVYAGALVGILEALDLLNNATEILDRNLGLQGIFIYMGLRLPTILDQILSLAVLLATIQTFNHLARHNEITALRSAGVTVGKLARLLLPVVLLIAAVHYLVKDRIVPYSERSLTLWWQQSEPVTGDESGPKSIWFRVGASILSIDSISDEGRRLEGLRIYERGEKGFISRIVAQGAEWKEGRWMLRQAMETDLRRDAAVLREPADIIWNINLDPATVLQLAAPNARLSGSAAGAALRGGAASNASPAYYEMQLYQAYTLPLSSIVMLLLGLPAAFTQNRERKMGLSLTGLVLGLLFLLSTGILSSFGQTGILPPLLAISASFVFFGAIGLHRLILLEESADRRVGWTGMPRRAESAKIGAGQED